MRLSKTSRRAGKFYAVFYPPLLDSRIDQRMMKYLDKYQIPYISFQHWDLKTITAGPLVLPGDSHPSPSLNETIAEGLKNYLK